MAYVYRVESSPTPDQKQVSICIQGQKIKLTLRVRLFRSSYPVERQSGRMTQTQPEGGETRGGLGNRFRGTAGAGDTAGHHLREVQSEDGTASLFKAELAGDVVTSLNGDAFASADLMIGGRGSHLRSVIPTPLIVGSPSLQTPVKAMKMIQRA